MMRARHLSALAALLCWPLAAPAFELDCATLREVVAGAGDGFEAFSGKPLSHVTAGASPDPSALARLKGEYSRETWQATRVLRGAGACTIARVHRADDTLRLQQAEYACRFPAEQALPASLGDELATCLGKPRDPDADEASLVITVDVVESGEGQAVLLVAADANVAEGLRLVVSRVSCEAKVAGACDD
jgi:hypothetical protein